MCNYFFSITLILFCMPIIASQSSDWSESECMDKKAKIFVAGHNGLVGSAIVRRLNQTGYLNIVTRSRQELDLLDQKSVQQFFEKERPDYVFLAAAKVGGIKANSDFPADFIYQNLVINSNVLHAAFVNSVKKLLFLGSSCIYPRDCPQPMKEEYLLSGYLEKTNEAYAVAKIAGIIMCQSYNRQHGTKFISCMPTNLYGPNDNFDLKTSHVLPALIAKIISAHKEKAGSVTIWGSGKPRREFLHVDDMADASVYLMQHYQGNEIVNVGTGTDVTIGELAQTIKEAVGYEGALVYNSKYPDGTPRKLLDVSKLSSHGWKAAIQLPNGIKSTIEWYNEHHVNQ